MRLATPAKIGLFLLIVLFIALAAGFDRSSTYHLDTLASSTRSRITILGVPIIRWTSPTSAGYPAEFESVSGQKPAVSHMLSRPPNYRISIWGKDDSDSGFPQEQRERLDLLEALYQKMHQGLSVPTAKTIYQEIDRLLPATNAYVAVDLPSVDAPRLKLGLQPRYPEFLPADQDTAKKRP